MLPDRLAAVDRAETAASRRDHGLQGLVQLAAEALDVSFGFLTLVGRVQEHLIAVWGVHAADLPPTLPVEESVCQHLVGTDAPLLVADLHAHPVLRDLVEVRALGLRSYAGVPVRSREGHVVGGLCVADSKVRDWSDADSALLRGLAEAASRELQLLVTVQELDRVRAKERRRAEEQAALHRVAAAVARGEAPELVLQRVTRELVGLLGASAALVLRRDATGGRDVVAAATGQSQDGTASASTGSPLDDSVREVLEQVRDGGPEVLTTASGLTCLVSPVQVEGRTWGAVVVVTLLTGDEDEPGACLTQLADFVGLVVVNAETTRLLQEAARTDPLTGAANRRAFEEQLATELARTHRHGQPLMLALVDVDHFKRINDRHGHDVGDRVLVELSDRVRGQLRSVDLLARVGGDEWALLLPGTDRDDGAAVLERVRAAMAATPLSGVAVTVTIGAAVAGAGAGAGTLYRAADRALYAAKSQGRDRLALEDRTAPDAAPTAAGAVTRTWRPGAAADGVSPAAR